MKMTKTRLAIREKRLEKYARILSNKYEIELKVSPSSRMIGCCDSSKKVWISSNLSDDVTKNLILQKAVTLHEIGHILFTKKNEWEAINRNLSNIVEDGRVEEAISRLLPKARLYLIYLNQTLFTDTESLKRCIENKHLPGILSTVMLRSAMKRTGIPQLDKETINSIVSVIGKEDYDYFKNRTREATLAKTDKEAAEITSEIEKRFFDITNGVAPQDNVSKTEPKSMENVTSNARQMPKEKEDEIASLLDTQDDESDDEQTEDNEIDNDNITFDIDDNEISLPQPTKKDGSGASDENGDAISDSDNGSSDIDSDDIDFDISSETNEDDDEEDDDEIDTVEDRIKSLINDIEETVSRESVEEIMNENEIIKSREADADFTDYDIDGEKEMKPRTKYGSYLKHVDSVALEMRARKVSTQFRVIAEKGDGWIHNQKHGRLDMHRINKLFNKNNTQPTVFKRMDKIQGTDLAVTVLLDASGSMEQGNKKYIATDVSYILARALELGKYKSEVVQFGTQSNYYNGNCYGLKSFNQKTQYAIKRFVPTAAGLTPLKAGLEGAEKSLSKQLARRKVILVVTDGYPIVTRYTEDGYREECAKKIKELESKGIVVIGVGIETRAPTGLFTNYILCRKVEELEQKLIGVMKDVIRKL